MLKEKAIIASKNLTFQVFLDRIDVKFKVRDDKMDNKKRVLTGLQPTGVITLGNYIGAIKQMVKYQEEYDSYIFVADLHSITVAQDVETLHSNIKSLIALYLACGIDPEKNTIFIQSENEYHTNLSWLLECNSYFGELSRMHQFKEKSKKNENFTAGLFTYPALMAADILLYDINFVPVGIDQKQHVELARDLAQRFNNKYGETFVIPEPLITVTGTKIMDLVDPTKKMSKSAENPKGVIKLLEDIEVIRKKIMSATTDSEMLIKYDPENKPGISNLINIYSALTGESVQSIEERFSASNYGTFKKEVAEVVINEVVKIQEKYNEYINSTKIDEMLDKGRDFTRKIAKAKYEEARRKMGLGR